MSELASKLSPSADHVYANYEPQITYIEDIWNMNYYSYEISVDDVSWEYMPMTDGWSDYIYSPVCYGQAFWFNEYSLALWARFPSMTSSPTTPEPTSRQIL